MREAQLFQEEGRRSVCLQGRTQFCLQLIVASATLATRGPPLHALTDGVASRLPRRELFSSVSYLRPRLSRRTPLRPLATSSSWEAKRPTILVERGRLRVLATRTHNTWKTKKFQDTIRLKVRVARKIRCFLENQEFLGNQTQFPHAVPEVWREALRRLSER